jgi:hypothetical protein
MSNRKLSAFEISNVRPSDSNIPIVAVKVLNSGQLTKNSSENNEL